MDTRNAARIGRDLSVIGLGTWQLGADWGDVTEADARAVLDASVESGVTIFDTADVYGDGRSEQFIGSYLADNPDLDVFVATKMGRREAQDPANFTLAKFREWTDRSRSNLGVDTLDLVQLHCPPTPVFSSDASRMARASASLTSPQSAPSCQVPRPITETGWSRRAALPVCMTPA